MAKLKSLQLVTRYCSIERPYWNCFLEYYKSLNVTLIHVCVQTDEEIAELASLKNPSELEIQIHKIPSNMPPNSALKSFNTKLLDSSIKYTALIDADEYITLFDQNQELDSYINPISGPSRLQWIMNPLTDIHVDSAQGFMGHSSKPIGPTRFIKTVVGDHRFKSKRFLSLRTLFNPSLVESKDLIKQNVDANLHNITFNNGPKIIHYWSRGIKDVLLKVFFSRFKSYKQADQLEALDKIRSGDVPNRMKMHAFLMCQKRYINLPIKFNSIHFDSALETTMLRQFISKDDEQQALENYYKYEEYLNDWLECHLNYPSYNIPTLRHLANFLPSMQSTN